MGKSITGILLSSLGHMGVHKKPNGSSQLFFRPVSGGHFEEVKTGPSLARRRDTELAIFKISSNRYVRLGFRECACSVVESQTKVLQTQ